MFHLNTLRFLPLALFLMLASCASPNFHDSITKPDWELSGKIGVREGLLSASSSLFQWRQQDDHYAIYLFNSLGQIDLTIIGDKHHAQSRQPDGQTHNAKTPEELLKELTGWYFPVSSSRYWLQGKTEGHETNILKSADGNLASFTTNEWLANISNYASVDGVLLPHKIKLEQQNLTITLVIKNHAHFNP